jgi:hypothetical protein
MLVMWAEPTDNAMTKLLRAEIVGGPDNNKDYWCATINWSDGEASTGMAIVDRVSWAPSVQVQREWAQAATYSEPRTYEASVQFARLPDERITVTVP